MSYHTIAPVLLPDGRVQITVTEAGTGDGKWIRLSVGAALDLAEMIEKLAKAGRKL